MIHVLLRIAAIILGWLSIAVGILGLFLPFLQGILFLALGVYLLMKFSPRFRAFTRHFRNRHHRIDHFLDKIEERIGGEESSKDDPRK